MQDVVFTAEAQYTVRITEIRIEPARLATDSKYKTTASCSDNRTRTPDTIDKTYITDGKMIN